MFRLVNVFVVVVVIGVSIYTFNIARWAQKLKNWRGAIGLYTLTLITLIFPLWLYFFRPV